MDSDLSPWATEDHPKAQGTKQVPTPVMRLPGPRSSLSPPFPALYLKNTVRIHFGKLPFSKLWNMKVFTILLKVLLKQFSMAAFQNLPHLQVAQERPQSALVGQALVSIFNCYKHTLINILLAKSLYISWAAFSGQVSWK